MLLVRTPFLFDKFTGVPVNSQTLRQSTGQTSGPRERTAWVRYETIKGTESAIWGTPPAPCLYDGIRFASTAWWLKRGMG
jgi:hypothetical protein